MSALLEIRNLSATFATRRGIVSALSNIDLSLAPGEILALVGESGAGKSLASSCINGLLPRNCRISEGEVLLEGQRIDNLSNKQMEKIRGAQIGTIFQDPLTSLNPLYTVCQQITRTLRAHRYISDADAQKRALELLEEVGIPGAAQRLHAYPHEFSGGMRQRVVIAMALALRPKLIIADEPTTALDVSIQAQILELLRRLSKDHGASVILVTHDMGVVAETADRVAVLYAGRIAETGPVADVLLRPAHPYTQGLLGSIPSMERKLARLPQIPGSMPGLTAIPQGCAFNPRCPRTADVCRQVRPEAHLAGARRVFCHFAEELAS
ncbi:ABC transporter ATP-binding protein [Devosia elaeis]|uniref:Methionine ABC transporter ATP-binding protein n=1 Tax=Devosia elaeis TaxID=1770058 RepID=A0A178HWW8_9HYPH|nr:ABC transporter ATP-binding protein [Devosia elaeis]OAM77127.1 methionine ABC transporter ATP-binding protein [Devosia elaeis]